MGALPPNPAEDGSITVLLFTLDSWPHLSLCAPSASPGRTIKRDPCLILRAVRRPSERVAVDDVIVDRLHRTPADPRAGRPREHEHVLPVRAFPRGHRDDATPVPEGSAAGRGTSAHGRRLLQRGYSRQYCWLRQSQPVLPGIPAPLRPVALSRRTGPPRCPRPGRVRRGDNAPHHTSGGPSRRRNGARPAPSSGQRSFSCWIRSLNRVVAMAALFGCPRRNACANLVACS
jgi:hypothetical protein